MNSVDDLQDLETLQLTPQQQHVCDSVIEWARDEEANDLERVMAGYAGVGKTTVIKAITQKLENSNISVGVASFTGKAVAVLKAKGVKHAQTLHSLLYHYDPKYDEFFPVSAIGYDLVIVDEASMVGASLYRDLLSYNKKILFVGDPAQLPPIEKNNPNVLSRPTYLLDEVHRQAQDSPILQFANIIRQRQQFGYGKLGDLSIEPISNFSTHLRDGEFDQVICGYNKSVRQVNNFFRIKNYGEDRGVLEVGEKIVCRKNNEKEGVYNGLIGYVDTMIYNRGGLVKCDINLDGEDRQLKNITLHAHMLDEFNTKHFRDNSATYWNYGYGITCHKAQGSEWESVLVKVEPVPSELNFEWLYTAVTRASKRLVVCIDM